MTDRDRFKTLNGKYSSLCHSCGRIVYNMWISTKHRRSAVAYGYYDAIWKMAWFTPLWWQSLSELTTSNRVPDERQELLLAMLGEKRAAKMMANI